MPTNSQLKSKIERILRKKFPQQGETVDVSDGSGDNIHVIVVSRQFDNMKEKSKQDLLWGAIDRSKLTDAEKVKISMILPYSPDDLK
jgi:acid stress-induced BolA-like protein IbaG/YrbA